MEPKESSQFSEEQGRSFASIGVMLGMVTGGLLGLVFGMVIDDSQWMILGAGGGIVIGLALGSAWDRRAKGL